MSSVLRVAPALSGLALLLLSGCNGGEADGFPRGDLSFTVVADASDGVDRPQDLEFHPAADRASELWIVNKGTEDTGSDMVIVHDAGSAAQVSEQRMDENAWHFMNLTSAIAFNTVSGNWANAPEVTDANHNGGTFTGPSLWSSNLDIFAMPSGGNGSHLDMIHQSPNSMGIAHDVDNFFWLFDGYSNEIVRYGFGIDHGPGNADHSDGRVKRYSSLPIERLPGVPAHMVVDHATNWLYICDPGNSQILRMDITSGERDMQLPMNFEELEVHVQMKNEVWEVFANTNLVEPSGIALKDGLLYVSDGATGEVIGYDLETTEEIGRFSTGAGRIVGLEIGPAGKLWYVDRQANTVVRIDGEE